MVRTKEMYYIIRCFKKYLIPMVQLSTKWWIFLPTKFEQEHSSFVDPRSTQPSSGVFFYLVTCQVDCFYLSNPQLVSISSSPVLKYRITCTCIL